MQHMDLEAVPYVMLSVSDTGCGMDEETLSQIFEPFFTTKDRDKGTGLGLSTVYGIVKQSDGHIRVESEPWTGTTVKVYLPRVRDIPETVVEEQRLFESFRGTETILLVEDDESVRSVVLAVLQRSGYKVLEANNPGEAILISEQHTGFIHLMVTDVVMPRMSAPELAERLAPWHPEMKVLYMSGYSDDGVVSRKVLESESFLEKPFTPEDLLRKVRQVLAAPRPESP